MSTHPSRNSSGLVSFGDVDGVRGEHLLTAETFIPRPREETFAFFAAAENLQEITPPELGFRILTPTPIPMAAGARIEYRLSLFGIPFSWHTAITHWEPHVKFVDEQLSGPYALWVHTHTFADAPGGTLVRDQVQYRLPFAPLGDVVHPLVRRQLRRVFTYRAFRLARLLAPQAR